MSPAPHVAAGEPLTFELIRAVVAEVTHENPLDMTWVRVLWMLKNINRMRRMRSGEPMSHAERIAAQREAKEGREE